jgi:hypothetical protein
MPFFELFSNRNKKPAEVIHYEFPDNVRKQVLHILCDIFGTSDYYEETSLSSRTFETVQKQLCREYGVFDLVHGNHRLPPQRDVVFFFLTASIEPALDVVMRTFKYLEETVSDEWRFAGDPTANISINEAIKELNARFRYNGMGYCYEQGRIVRFDSTYAHAEITQPTLSLIQVKKFAGANEEYLKAHEHYKHGRNKECLVECLKAFESTMKVICKEKGWKYDEQKATASTLIQICFDNQLLPVWAQSQFTSLQQLIKSGVPTIRNRHGGHGQGQFPQVVDDEIVRYGLNLTGSNIILLVELSKKT